MRELSSIEIYSEDLDSPNSSEAFSQIAGVVALRSVVAP
jgi:hypothetical protein